LLRQKRGAECRIDEKACGQRGADPHRARPCRAACPHQCRTVGLPCPVRTNRAIDDRIEHGLRHTFPGSDSRFPYSENLPMGMSAKSIG
jgi:hypothetical protein